MSEPQISLKSLNQENQDSLDTKQKDKDDVENQDGPNTASATSSKVLSSPHEQSISNLNKKI